MHKVLVLLFFISFVKASYLESPQVQQLKSTFVQSQNFLVENYESSKKVVEKYLASSNQLIRENAQVMEAYLPRVIDEQKEDKKVFHWIPNAVSIIPIEYQGVEIQGDSSARLVGLKRADKDLDKFHLLKGFTVGNVYYPYQSWAWRIKLGPDLMYSDFNKSSNFKVLHLSYGVSLLWHFSPEYGTIAIKGGIGPLLLDGHLYEGEESRRLTLAPLVKLYYYRFFGEKKFIQLKYKSVFFMEDDIFSFEEGIDQSYSLEQVTTLSLNLGLKF